MVEPNPLAWSKEDPKTWDDEPFENFLDEHLLYHAINCTFWESWNSLDKIDPKFFSFNKKEKEKGYKELSIDWSKYSTPGFTFKCHNPDHQETGIMMINILKLKNSIEDAELSIIVEHKPIKKIDVNHKYLNKAHSLIKGLTTDNYSAVRTELSDIADWVDGYKPIKKESKN